jgi:hypothetical protein
VKRLTLGLLLAIFAARKEVHYPDCDILDSGTESD